MAIIPFSISYAVALKENFNEDNYPEILDRICDLIIDMPVKNVVITCDQLSFKTYGGSRTNVMATIDKGVFTLIKHDRYVELTYDFFMYKLFIYAPIMAIVAGVFLRSAKIGIFAFVWLCGANWISALVRHGKLLKRIGKQIDAYMEEKKEHNNNTSYGN